MASPTKKPTPKMPPHGSLFSLPANLLLKTVSLRDVAASLGMDNTNQQPSSAPTQPTPPRPSS